MSTPAERIDQLEKLVDILLTNNQKLREAIRKHQDAQSHEMCWENDETLYACLGERGRVDHTPPPRCEFRAKCKEYYESRPGADKAPDGW